MSQSTLDIMNGHRKEAVENSPSSETFSIVGGELTFKGIFDRSPEADNKDKGNIQQKQLKPRIMVNSKPIGLTEHLTMITRENGIQTFKFSFYEIDDEGQGLVWLY
jgi:hypothetical protein